MEAKTTSIAKEAQAVTPSVTPAFELVRFDQGLLIEQV
jgi:hypothetical protein